MVGIVPGMDAEKCYGSEWGCECFLWFIVSLFRAFLGL